MFQDILACHTISMPFLRVFVSISKFIFCLLISNFLQYVR